MTTSPTASEMPPSLVDDPRWALVQRVAQSAPFRTSNRLKEFLLYAAGCALRDAPDEVTEQQIGMHVFHRAAGYNSSEDSIVRTHARLLRQKLTTYFAEEGANEELIIEIPKGHYLPVFRSVGKPASEPPSLDALPSDPDLHSPAPHGGKRRKRVRSVLITLAIFVCLLVVGTAGRHWRTVSASSSLETFWRPFFHADAPLVIFSNATFLGTAQNGLRYATAEDRKNPAMANELIDTYTGIGEASAIYDLTKLFDAHQANFVLKRSQLVTWDEAKLRDLIFIGSQAENPALQALPSISDFSVLTNGITTGIVNHHPKPGEPRVYTRPEHPLTSDYAIIALLPGLQSGKHIVVMSGMTTLGTQAAVEYLCRPDDVRALLRLVSTPRGEIRPFEAVLKTTILDGVPMETRLVTIRVH